MKKNLILISLVLALVFSLSACGKAPAAEPATPAAEPQTAEDITPTLEHQAPMIGEHTVEVLKEYGYEDDVIRKYIEDGVVTVAE